MQCCGETFALARRVQYRPPLTAPDRYAGTPPASRPMPKNKGGHTHDRPRLAHPRRHPGAPPAPAAALNPDTAGPAPRRRPAFLQYTVARPLPGTVAQA
ncbi:protein of unknown function [Cupriavidus taiwanensis]|nr:hypothetical protein CBM2585_A50010 [Cupriavidus taiwanensis]SOZ01601.1 hypothetical protein CBM2595_A30452 [Cupriavidus taiwanensis]SOZ04625.1 hypothetical protein CBM2597_A50596 [Cupriavidus taiwanensis]SPD38918.1 protein of unknown function [Cupriavidus taiwanensis]